jgi:hypothetical protein
VTGLGRVVRGVLARWRERREDARARLEADRARFHKMARFWTPPVIERDGKGRRWYEQDDNRDH